MPGPSSVGNVCPARKLVAPGLIGGFKAAPHEPESRKEFRLPVCHEWDETWQIGTIRACRHCGCLYLETESET